MDNVCPTIVARRTHITPRPNVKLSLWSIMKNCIGKELTKIPMPVSREGNEYLESNGRREGWKDN